MLGKTTDDITPARPKPEWEKPTEDYSERLARRTQVSGVIVSARLERFREKALYSLSD